MITFVAQFRSRCFECDEWIEVGEDIGAISGQGYRHVKCPDDPDDKPTKFRGTTLDEMGY